MRNILSTMILVLLFCASAFTQSESLQCPSISVFGPSSVTQPNEPMFFSASVGSEIQKYDFKYKWIIDKGKIINGQGTTTIQVSTDGLKDTALYATLEIEGLPKDCVNKDSEAGVVAQKREKHPIDQYPKISFPDELARFDVFLAELIDNSDYEGFVWITTDKNESVSKIKEHIKKLVKHVKYKKIAPNRIIFAIDRTEYHSTTIFLMFQGEKLPNCEGCEIIKGSDLK